MNIKVFISTLLLSFSYIYSMELSSNPKGVYIVSCNESVTIDQKDKFEKMGVHIISYVGGTNYDYLARIKDAGLLDELKSLEFVRDVKVYNIEEHCDIKIDFKAGARNLAHMEVTAFEIQDRANLEEFFHNNEVKFEHFGRKNFIIIIYKNQNYLQIIDQLKIMPEVASIKSAQFFNIS